MQQFTTRLPVKFGRPFGRAMLLGTFFIVAQVMMSFHSHNPLVFDESDEPAHHQVECDVCLIAHMASHSGEDINLQPPSPLGGGTVIALPQDSWSLRLVSPGHARAPPRA